ncbi:MAG: conjugal transfer protein TraB [Deltaproteobacteria bacterium]|nr:conjugal transfer protein TraB [Deltaproteobacteria bacterium]
MASIDEQVLRAAKEIVVKFIENGRVSPAGFSETFKDIYSTVEETVKGSKESKENPGQKSESGKKDK